MESIYAMKYKRWFHGIFVKNRVSKIISYPRHSVEKWEIHCHANFFTSNQFIVKFFSKTLIWRNFCDKTVAVKFQNFPQYEGKIRENEQQNFCFFLISRKKSWNCVTQLFMTLNSRKNYVHIHSVENTWILSHAILAKISWK